MFGREFTLFHLFGFRVRINLTWLFLALIVAWSLAEGLFPQLVPERERATYWLLGVGGVIGLLLSIVLHELSHSLVARRFGLPIRGITLFIFGGIAEMEDEPPTPRSEFWMAIAGPIASFLIAATMFLLLQVAAAQLWPVALAVIIVYLFYLNLVLGIFNLLPAYPLDGGRVLRSLLWARSRDIHRATWLASRVGVGFGLLLIGLGFIAILSGFGLSGVWWILIGMFLYQGAEGAYQQLRMKQGLEGRFVRDIMSHPVVTVPPHISLQEFFRHYVYKFHHRMFPVVEDDRIVGCMNTRSVRGIPERQWEERTVGELTSPCSEENTLTPSAPAAEAISRMAHTGNSRLMVVEGDRLVGVLTARDLLTRSRRPPHGGSDGRRE